VQSKAVFGLTAWSVNSHLKKGDKGGCEPEVGALSSRNGRRKQKTTPSAPFFKGEYCGNFAPCLCPAVFMVRDHFTREGNEEYSTEKSEAPFFKA